MEQPDPTSESPILLLEPPKIDATLGSYRLVKLLGVGGMGRVYLAEHQRLGRKMALKLLHPQYSSDPEIVRRFFNEARAVNQISHPNIVEIVDFVEDPHGFNYFIMELLDGRDLRQVHDSDGPFGLERTVEIGKQVASALAAAHEQGIVHRDIKPDNVVLLPREGKPHFIKLLDFGIAKLLTGVAQKDQTRLGMVLGTPGYMSPEQALGRPVDGRSDIYSLGVLLFWMLSDRLPSAAYIPMQPLPSGDPAPEPLTINPLGQPIPKALAELVQRCLRFSADERVQTMKHVRDELSWLAPPGLHRTTGLPIPSPEAPTVAERASEAAPVPATDPAGPALDSAGLEPLASPSSAEAPLLKTELSPIVPEAEPRPRAPTAATRIRSSARGPAAHAPSLRERLLAALERPKGRIWLGVIAAALVVAIGLFAVLNQDPMPQVSLAAPPSTVPPAAQPRGLNAASAVQPSPGASPAAAQVPQPPGPGKPSRSSAQVRKGGGQHHAKAADQRLTIGHSDDAIVTPP